MFNPEENAINNCESDSDSNFEDEDELTRILPPEGTWLMENLCVIVNEIFYSFS